MPPPSEQFYVVWMRPNGNGRARTVLVTDNYGTPRLFTSPVAAEDCCADFARRFSPTYRYAVENAWLYRNLLDSTQRALVEAGGPLPDDLEAMQAEVDYVNETCPAECSTEHDDPYVDREGQFRCPETGDDYRWCDLCGEWSHDRWRTGSTRANGEWVCDLSEHDLFECDGCGAIRDYDNYYAQDGYCTSCYESHDEYDDGGCDCEDCRQERGYVGGTGEPLTVCRSCGTPNVHFEEVAESFLCDCAALAAKRGKRPVLLAHPLTERELVTA